MTLLHTGGGDNVSDTSSLNRDLQNQTASWLGGAAAAAGGGPESHADLHALRRCLILGMRDRRLFLQLEAESARGGENISSSSSGEGGGRGGSSDLKGLNAGSRHSCPTNVEAFPRSAAGRQQSPGGEFQLGEFARTTSHLPRN